MTSEIEVDAGIGGEATDPAALRQYHNTIRKLVTQVQEEKRLRRELEEKQATVDEQRHLQSELDQAWARSGEDAARAARVEVQLTEVRQELEDLRKLHSSICERLLHTESESAQRLEEIFARDIKIADLEGALRDAQGRAASAEDEAKRFSTKLATASQQVSLSRARSPSFASTWAGKLSVLAELKQLHPLQRTVGEGVSSWSTNSWRCEQGHGVQRKNKHRCELQLEQLRIGMWRHQQMLGEGRSGL